VRWFEVDHPNTQRDKRVRLERLGIDTTHVTFVAADFEIEDVAAQVRGAGHNADQTSLFLCEGVAVYLERAVLESLLRELRALAAPGSRLAISVSASGGGAEQIARREEFRRRVAAAGETARTFLTADDADALFADTGWQVAPSTNSAEAQQRARRAGFVVIEPS
jgi:methyltransferase (TIGR00027 family)